MEQNTEMLLNEENLESMIYEIRGERVMLDFDLARIYGYETRAFNQQIKNNIEKYPSDFMFRLTTIESEYLVMPKKSASRKTSFFLRTIWMYQKTALRFFRKRYLYAYDCVVR